MKQCNECKTIKSNEDFHKCKSYKDGLQYRCKSCTALRDKEYNKTEKRKLSWKLHDDKRRGTDGRKNQRNKRKKERRQEDINYRISENIRSRTSDAIKRDDFTKSQSTLEHIGCSASDLKKYLESKFHPEMSWDNYGFGVGKWTIDHIVPLASAKSIDDIYKLSHFSNLQPLWYVENIAKKDKIILNGEM